MDRNLITAAGAAAILATGPAAAQTVASQAPAVPVAQSYAELLEPIADASNRLKISDAQAAARRPALQPIQYDRDNDQRHDHHHHHHHHHSNDWYAQNGYTFLGGRWESAQEFARNHHHHHHHHHSQDRDDR